MAKPLYIEKDVFEENKEYSREEIVFVLHITVHAFNRDLLPQLFDTSSPDLFKGEDINNAVEKFDRYQFDSNLKIDIKSASEAEFSSNYYTSIEDAKHALADGNEDYLDKLYKNYCAHQKGASQI